MRKHIKLRDFRCRLPFDFRFDEQYNRKIHPREALVPTYLLRGLHCGAAVLATAYSHAPYTASFVATS